MLCKCCELPSSFENPPVEKWLKRLKKLCLYGFQNLVTLIHWYYTLLITILYHDTSHANLQDGSYQRGCVPFNWWHWEVYVIDAWLSQKTKHVTKKHFGSKNFITCRTCRKSLLSKLIDEMLCIE